MFQFFSCFIELLVFYETGLMKFWFLIDGFVKNLILVSVLIESLIFDEGGCFILIYICVYDIILFFCDGLLSLMK
jgi:hypothetical protein